MSFSVSTDSTWNCIEAKPGTTQGMDFAGLRVSTHLYEAHAPALDLVLATPGGKGVVEVDPFTCAEKVSLLLQALVERVQAYQVEADQGG